MREEKCNGEVDEGSEWCASRLRYFNMSLGLAASLTLIVGVVLLSGRGGEWREKETETEEGISVMQPRSFSCNCFHRLCVLHHLDS